MGRLQAALELCDRATVTTPSLARHIHSKTGMDVRVVPNFLNRDQIAVSGAIFNAKAISDFAFGDTLYVGYFSGSPSHSKDFEDPTCDLSSESFSANRGSLCAQSATSISGTPLQGDQID